MIKDWSLDTIKHEIDKIAYAESDPRMDGFVTFGCKQDLYRVLFYVQSKLDKCSTYAGEEEWVNNEQSYPSH